MKKSQSAKTVAGSQRWREPVPTETTETTTPAVAVSTAMSPAAEFNSELAKARESIKAGNMTPEADFVQLLILACKGLRDLRDKQLYREGGFQTFRQWCVSSFGERFGTLMENNL